MGAVSSVVQAVSDTVSHVGQVISESPIAQAAITVGGTMLGIPPAVTAGVLGANQASQTGNLTQGLLTGGLSYLGGNAINGALGSATTAAGATAAEQQAAQTLISQGYSPSAAWELVNAGGAGVTSTFGAGSATGGLLGTLGNAAGNVVNGILGGGAGGTAGGGSGAAVNAGLLTSGLQTGMQLAGSYLNQQAAADAATKQADAQIRAAQIAADAAKFRPVGVTTNFGSSNFGYDDKGNLTSAGYTLTPQLQAQQNQLMGATGGLMNQYLGAQGATTGMHTAAQQAMTLGNQYLATSPQAQAAKYLADQQGLLAPGRAQELANLQAQNAAQGRTGFAMGGGVNGQLAANPEMQAYWNARMQQDAQLAANATQGGMDYAKFGLGTVGSGGDLLSSMYRTQTAASSPYTNALGVAQGIESMGQGAMDLGTSIGAKSSTGAAQAGLLTSQGMTNAANIVGSQAQQAGSTWGNLLSGGANAWQNYTNPQTNAYDPGKFRLVPL